MRVPDLTNIRNCIDRNLPTILEYSSILGFTYVLISSNIHTVSATRDADEITKKGGSKKDVLKKVSPRYIPDAIVFGASVYAGVKSDKVHTMRTETALLVADIASRKYDHLEKQVKELGAKKSDLILNKAHEDEYISQRDLGAITSIPGSGGIKVYDPILSKEFMTTMSSIRAAFNEINKMLRTEQFVNYNELYYQLKLPGCSAGESLFWFDDDGYIEFRDDFFELDEDGETPILFLSYNHAPKDKFTKYHYQH